jgi:hypothetical protein
MAARADTSHMRREKDVQGSISNWTAIEIHAKAVSVAIILLIAVLFGISGTAHAIRTDNIRLVSPTERAYGC